MNRSLVDMVALITGASAGIGRALAVELAGDGARLALVARREQKLEELNAQLGGKHLCIVGDVANPEDCQRAVTQTHAHFGRLDTLVCNAGYGALSPVAAMPADDVTAMFQTNVFGTLDCIRAATPLLENQPLRDGWRGQIVIISSAVARRGLPFFGVYSATKAAQLSIAEALRVELAEKQIAVTSVHPGGTSTEFGDVSASKSEGRRPKKIAGEIQQSAELVAQRIARGIIHPVPEVWPNRAYRWLTGIGCLFPGVVDRVMRSRRDAIGGRRESDPEKSG